MKRLLFLALILALPPLAAAPQPAAPVLQKTVPLFQGRFEVPAGQTRDVQAQVPPFAEDETPALALRVRVHTPGAGGCNWILQVLVNGWPLTESLLHHRLLNKLPWFDPPGTKYHFRWYNAQRQAWMTIFGRSFDFNWGGTGRDFDFVFDLSGLVEPGASVRIGFRHAMSYLPQALEQPRAPLVVENARLGVLKRREVERLRELMQAGEGLQPAPVSPDLPADAKPGPRPYEVVWSGRRENPPAQIAFDRLQGWTLWKSGDMNVALEASVEQRLWRPRLAKLTYEGGSQPCTLVLKPPKPIPIEGPFDAANLWAFGRVDRRHDRLPRLTAHLEDREGQAFAVDLGYVHNSYWVLLHGVLDASVRKQVKWPARFVGLTVALNPPKKDDRALYLESLAFYEQHRRPFVRNTLPAKPAFPVNDDGMLPTRPANVRTDARSLAAAAEFISESPEGVLRFRIEPARGVLNGVRARWANGPWFKPMAEGRLLLDEGEEQTAEVVSAKLERGAYRVRWRGAAEWMATYRLRGRTLVVDVECPGGRAVGMRFGCVAGLPDVRTVEVPYLTYGAGRGPLIACGRDAFASVLVDWHHSACSRINSLPPADEKSPVALIGGVDYLPLTNGRRNPLRERVLVTVSPRFADVLPNIPNPASPFRERLKDYMFHMVSHMRPNYLRTLKRYGIDNLIACDFARFYVKEFPEGFSARWRPHPSLTLKQIQDYRGLIKSLGYLFGAYSDLRDFYPFNEFFDENRIALDSGGGWAPGWFGSYRTKPNFMPVLARLVGEKVHALYPPDAVYMDTHTCARPIAVDFEAGVPGAGVARDQIYFNMQCILETKKWYGAVMSEGAVRWMYAGIADMDYASLFASRPADEMPALVDFDLLKIHPLNFGTMMGYSPSVFYRRSLEKWRAMYSEPGRGLAPIEFYQYVAASLAYGHMLMLGYSYVPSLARTIHLYALMQGVQKEYLTDAAAEIRYHDGRGFVTTGQALRERTRRLDRVRVRYTRGLTVWVNYNAAQHWRVDEYELPPYGWLVKKPGDVLAFSALVQGDRVDYVRCPEYIYLNTGARRVRVGPVEVAGAVWLKREAKGWRLIPCGDLGRWEVFPPPGLPPWMQAMRVRDVPENRGCSFLAVDTNMLLGKPPAAVRVTARAESGASVKPRTLSGAWLEITPSADVVDYLLR